MSSKIYKATADCWKWGFTAYYSSLDTALKLIPIDTQFRRVVDWDRPRERKLEDSTILYPKYDAPLNIILNRDSSYEGVAYRVKLADYQWKLVKRVHHPEVKEPGKLYVPAGFTTQDLGIVTKDETTITTVYIEEIRLDELSEND